MKLVQSLVEVAHANFSKITRMAAEASNRDLDINNRDVFKKKKQLKQQNKLWTLKVNYFKAETSVHNNNRRA
jgi:phytoene/squalene synthetase